MVSFTPPPPSLSQNLIHNLSPSQKREMQLSLEKAEMTEVFVYQYVIKISNGIFPILQVSKLRLFLKKLCSLSKDALLRQNQSSKSKADSQLTMMSNQVSRVYGKQ